MQVKEIVKAVRDEETLITAENCTESLARIEVQRTQKKEIHTVDCHCLPACTSLEYDAQVSVADYEWQDAFEAHNTSLDELGKG